MKNDNREKKTAKTARKKRKWLKRTALIVCLAIVLGLMSFFAIQIYVTQSAKRFILGNVSEAPVCDAVMVLGALVYNSGYPSPILRDRLDYGYELYIQGKAKKILVSGDHGQTDYDEVNAMKAYLLQKGVPSEDVFMDHAGFNTYDSMYRAKEIFLIESLLISTQEFHIHRSVYIAHKLGIDAYGYPCKDKSSYPMFTLNLRESFARAKAFWDVTVHRSPKYSGGVIPISGNGDLTAG
jgi:vancomycin permeability regulator SanA